MTVDIEAVRAAAQDTGTRQASIAVQRDAVPRLLLLSWVQRIVGDDGLGCWDRPSTNRVSEPGLRLIHSIARELDGHIWSHTSVSRSDRKMPTWEQTRDVFRLVHPHDYGVIVIPPGDRHVNIAEVAHVWCNLDQPTVPDFTHGLGTI